MYNTLQLLTLHTLLSNIQSGACNKLVIAWQGGRIPDIGTAVM